MSDEKPIDPENKTWKRGDDPEAAAIALAEASLGTTGANHHAGEAATQMREAQEGQGKKAAKGEKAEASKAQHGTGAHKADHDQPKGSNTTPTAD